MWNDTDIPLAFLITFRGYGTWVHGDQRGSTDQFRKIYKGPRIPRNEKWKAYNQRVLKSEPVTLNASRRHSVDKAIRQTCAIRKWHLYAASVRTNHAHVVVSIGTKKPSVALNALKANATRQMREDDNWIHAHSPWADKGSERYLWNEQSLAIAIDYVLNGQGEDLPDLE